jgi:electron transfer flavoprotein beta subunit
MTVIVAALGWSWLDAEVDPLTGAVSASPRDRGAGPADLAALEHALRLAQRWQARVVAATVGPGEADPMLRDALAAGAAEALRVEPASRTQGPRPALLVGGPDAAAALAAALIQRYGVPDLVLCGDRSADRGTGSFPAFLAAALDAAQALGVVRIEPGDDGKLRVHRRLDGGRREVLLLSRPAVVSVEAAGVRLRRAGLPATLASRHAVIPVASAPKASAAPRVRVLGAHPYRPRPRELAGPSGSALRRMLELTGALTERTPPTVLGPLSAGQAADELLGYLRRRGYLAASDLV